MSTDGLPEEHAAMEKAVETMEGFRAAPCSRFAEERKALLSKLSGMHDQYCHCMGKQPDALLLTPYSAEVLDWEEGFRTPFYATVTDTGELQDIFTANSQDREPGGSAGSSCSEAGS